MHICNVNTKQHNSNMEDFLVSKVLLANTAMAEKVTILNFAVYAVSSPLFCWLYELLSLYYSIW